ncbi:energy transducer TonB [uncultured Aquincola sp.]|uniref:energy transducer TonB n=1 Tax=uncultured Aquincola sp. TaxID=886556 RepID=UPI0032B26F47
MTLARPAAAVPAAPAPAPLRPPAQRDELPGGARTALTAGIVVAHVAALWALLQVDAVRQAVAEVAPIVVDMVAPPAPVPTPPPPPPPPQPRPKTPPAPAPIIAAAPSPSPTPPTFVAPPPPPEPPVPQQVFTPPAPPAPPAPAPAPAGPKVVPASALRWRVQPPIEVPLASRRMGESGTVVLRVVVDTRGMPAQWSVIRSSGYPRLDANATSAMAQARFEPCTENGVAVVCESTATLSYELER